jgi:hypothetical protein
MGAMSKRGLHIPGPRPRNRRRKPAPPKPKRNPVLVRARRAGSTGSSVALGQVMQLVHEAEAEERAAGDPVQAYHVRQRLEQRLSALAERVGAASNPTRDDLLALALAGWYASGARHALVRAILRAGGIDPAAPNLGVRPRGRSRGPDLA